MIFRRNLFYPVRLLLYPALIETMAGTSGLIVSESIWTIFSVISILLTIEAVWEFVHPYAVLNESIITINASILSKITIDLSKYTADDVLYHDWYLQIGKEFISLRRIRAGYRDRFEEAIELYLSPGLHEP